MLDSNFNKMKKIIKYTLFSALIATLGLQSCKDSYFEEVTKNPNLVDVASMSSLLSTSTYKAGRNNYNVSNITSYFAQYLANPSANGLTDTYQQSDYTSTWDALYFAMADANELKKLAVAQNASEYKGVADVLIVYNLNLANDLWGTVPFSAAFDKNNVYPKYDKDEDVYKASMLLIDEAIVELQKTGSPFKIDVTNDLIYGNNSAKSSNQRLSWLKLAYALKARMLNKVSKTAGYNPTAVLAAVGNSFASNTDDAGMNALFTSVNRNFWSNLADGNARQSLDGWLSEQLVDHINGTTYGIIDPRAPKITDKAPVNGLFIGTVNGAGNRLPGANTLKDECYVSPNSPWTSDTAPISLVTFAELKFIEAEAAFATDKPRAYAAYLAGITANMDKLQVATTDKATYLADTRVAVGASALTLDLIFKEKYVATYLNPEAWNDARRYDYKYKNFTLPTFAVLTSFIRRVDYPKGEIDKNKANVPADVPRTTKLWWDQ
jgi:hypothetical protein